MKEAGLKNACLLVIWLSLTLSNPMDCSPSGSSVHEILQPRILEWTAIFSSRRIKKYVDIFINHHRYITGLTINLKNYYHFFIPATIN